MANKTTSLSLSFFIYMSTINNFFCSFPRIGPQILLVIIQDKCREALSDYGLDFHVADIQGEVSNA